MDGDQQAADLRVHGAPLDLARVLTTQWLELGHTLRQADLKAQVLLGIDAILLTGLLRLDAGSALDFTGLSGVLEGLALITLLGSIGFALLTVLPRQSHSRTDEEVLLYFGGMARLSEEAFLERYMALPLDTLKQLVLADLHAQARIAVRKFQRVWTSMAFLGSAVLLWIISHLVQ